jgi:hypothetical protein
MDMSAESDEQPEEIAAAEPELAVAQPEAEKVADEDAPEAGVADDVATSHAESDAKIAAVEAPPKRKKRRRSSAAKPSKGQPTLRQVTARFAGCVRCSYFWAGYRVIHGVAELETAVAHSKSGWLELEWDQKMPELVYKTYGVRMDISHFHYEGCCKECRRHFIYKAAENEEDADSFCIEISPRIAK